MVDRITCIRGDCCMGDENGEYVYIEDYEKLVDLLAETFDHVKACHGCLEHGGTPDSDLDKRILAAIGR